MKKIALLIGLVVALILLAVFSIFTKTASEPEEIKPNAELRVPKHRLHEI